MAHFCQTRSVGVGRHKEEAVLEVAGAFDFDISLGASRFLERLFGHAGLPLHEVQPGKGDEI